MRRVDETAGGVREYKRVAFDREPFDFLTFRVAPKRFYGPLRQTDASAAVRGLGRFERLPSATDDEGALYTHNPAVEVYVGPEQSPQFPDPCTRGQTRDVEGVVSVASCRREETFSFLSVEGAYLRRRHPRGANLLANVLVYQSPPQRVVEGGRQHAVDASYPCRRQAGVSFLRVQSLDLLPSQVLELLVSERREQVQPRDVAVGFQAAPLHGVPHRVVVLREELPYRDVRRGGRSAGFFVVRYGLRQLVDGLLAGASVDATPGSAYQVPGFPPSIRPLARAATLAVAVLPRHEPPPVVGGPVR